VSAETQHHYATAPEDRIPFILKVVYGLGGFVNNLLAAAIGGMVIVLNLGLGMSPAMVGLLASLPRLTDALTDPLMGYISDRTRSRWGRRRPYIFAGAILSGLLFIALWQLPRGHSETFHFVYFLVGSIVFYLAYTMFATPWVALGYELTPDYHERTRLMGTQNFFAQIPFVVAPWFLAIMTNKRWFADQLEGARVLAVLVAVVVIGVGVLPAIFLRERFADVAATGRGDAQHATPAGREREVVPSVGFGRAMAQFFRGFLLTLKSKPFLLLCAATFLVFNGFILISSFSSYVIIYYVMGGDQGAGSTWVGYAGSVGAASTFVVVVGVTWLATKIGKRRAFFVSTGVSIVGYLLKWVCYDPAHPFLVVLPTPLMAFGLGGLFTLMPSMMADVVDLDELATGERREGMYGSIFWWVIKLGMALALAAGGRLLVDTGFDVALGAAQSPRALLLMRVFDVACPAVASLLAIWAVAAFPLTEQRAHDVRVELERRRGAA
jgi:GPH family glycoside/pentoside/hexuronide:cation symporter